MAAPDSGAPPGCMTGGRRDSRTGDRPTRYYDTPPHPAAQACSLPESADGACAAPLRCPCRGLQLFEELLALARRYERGRLIVAEALDTDPQTIDALVEHRLVVDAARTPEARAREAA